MTANIMTTGHLIALAKKRLRTDFRPMTDYRLAKLLGVRQALVSNWQLGKNGIGRKYVGKFAAVTGLAAAYVYACLELEREKDPVVRDVLLQVARDHADARRAA